MISMLRWAVTLLGRRHNCRRSHRCDRRLLALLHCALGSCRMRHLNNGEKEIIELIIAVIVLFPVGDDLGAANAGIVKDKTGVT